MKCPTTSDLVTLENLLSSRMTLPCARLTRSWRAILSAVRSQGACRFKRLLPVCERTGSLCQWSAVLSLAANVAVSPLVLLRGNVSCVLEESGLTSEQALNAVSELTIAELLRSPVNHQSPVVKAMKSSGIL